MRSRKICVVANPSAGAGRASRVVEPIRAALEHAGFEVEILRTSRPHEAGELLRRAVDRADEAIIGIMGGDGTFNEAIQGLESNGAIDCAPGTTLALVPAGTGGDLRKTLRMPEDPVEIAQALARATARPFDLGRIHLRNASGDPCTRLFGNIADAGIGGEAVNVVNNGPKWLGGKLAFFYGSLRANVTYRNLGVRVKVDGVTVFEGLAFLVVVANGKAFGAGMYIAPMADPHDGLFDVVILGNYSTTERLMLSYRVYRGSHIGRPDTIHLRGRVVEIEPSGDKPMLIDADGEAPGQIPARFEMLPSVVNILAND